MDTGTAMDAASGKGRKKKGKANENPKQRRPRSKPWWS